MVISAAACGTVSCIQDHDILAARGAGGAMGRGGSGGAWVDESGGAAGQDSAPDASAGGAPFVPDGPRTLTVLHGVTDSPWVAFCFARVDSGSELPSPGKPLPRGGLDWGASAAVSPPGLDPSRDAIRPYVVAAHDAGAVDGLACTTIVQLSRIPPLRPPPPPPVLESGTGESGVPRDASSADGSDATSDARDATTRAPEDGASRDATLDAPLEASVPTDASEPIPGLRVAALPVIPGGELALERSYLLVASGCMGGPGIGDPSERSVCGDAFSKTTPTLAPIIVALSRTVPSDHVGLAFLDATPTFTHCDVRFAPPIGGDPLPFVSDVVTGALRPAHLVTKWSVADLGASSSTAKIRVHAGGSDDAAYDQPWAPTLSAANLQEIENGKAYTLVLIGPYPTFTKRHFWNAPLVAIVPN